MGETSDIVQAVRDRERLLHSLGNLTLVNGRLNRKLSNARWVEKHHTLGKYTVLHLNKNLLDTYQETAWGEGTIQERGTALAQIVGDH